MVSSKVWMPALVTTPGWPPMALSATTVGLDQLSPPSSDTAITICCPGKSSWIRPLDQVAYSRPRQAVIWG